MGELKSKLNEVAVAVKQALVNVSQSNEEPMNVAPPGGRIQVN
jgi:hypothetical protein